MTIKPEIIKLLQHANWHWNDCEFGAPEIDPKRPYGNPDVLNNIAEILGIEMIKDADGDFFLREEDADYLRDLHKETLEALPVIIAAYAAS